MRGGTIHARVAHTTVDPDQYETARKVLETEVLPRVRQVPGVVVNVDGTGLTQVTHSPAEYTGYRWLPQTP